MCVKFEKNICKISKDEMSIFFARFFNYFYNYRQITWHRKWHQESDLHACIFLLRFVVITPSTNCHDLLLAQFFYVSLSLYPAFIVHILSCHKMIFFLSLYACFICTGVVLCVTDTSFLIYLSYHFFFNVQFRNATRRGRQIVLKLGDFWFFL